MTEPENRHSLADAVNQWNEDTATTATPEAVAELLAIARAETSKDEKLWDDFVRVVASKMNPTRDAEARAEALQLAEAVTAPGPESEAEDEIPEVPLAALPPTFRKLIVAMDRQTNAAPCATLTAGICAIGMATQGRYKVAQGKFNDLTMSQFGIISASSGDGKGGIFNITNGVEAAGDENREMYACEDIAYRKAKKAYDKAIEDIKGATQAEVAKAIRNVPRPKPSMLYPQMIEKPSSNGILNNFIDRPCTSVATSEAGTLLKSFATKPGNEIEFAGTLTSAWNGEKMGRSTGMDGQGGVYLRGRGISMLLLAQTSIVAEFMSNAGYEDQGLLNRMLAVRIEGRTRRMHREMDRYASYRDEDHRAIETFNRRIKALALEPIVVNDWCEPQAKYLAWNGEGRPDRDSPAHARMTDWEDDFLNPKTRDPNYARVVGFVKRLHEIAYKIAGGFALLQGRTTIENEDVEGAIACAEYYLAERLRIVNSLPAAVNQRSPEAQVYKAACDNWAKVKEKLGDERSTINTVRSKIRSLKNLPVKTSNAIFREMIDQGWLHEEKVGKAQYISVAAIGGLV